MIMTDIRFGYNKKHESRVDWERTSTKGWEREEQGTRDRDNPFQASQD